MDLSAGFKQYIISRIVPAGCLWTPVAYFKFSFRIFKWKTFQKKDAGLLQF